MSSCNLCTHVQSNPGRMCPGPCIVAIVALALALVVYLRNRRLERELDGIIMKPDSRDGSMENLDLDGPINKVLDFLSSIGGGRLKTRDIKRKAKELEIVLRDVNNWLIPDIGAQLDERYGDETAQYLRGETNLRAIKRVVASNMEFFFLANRRSTDDFSNEQVIWLQKIRSLGLSDDGMKMLEQVSRTKMPSCRCR